MRKTSKSIHKLIFIVILSIFNLSLLSTEELDLQTCIEECIKNNPRANQYRLLMQAAKYEIKENAALIIPNLWFSSNFAYNYSVYNYDKNQAEYDKAYGTDDEEDFGNFLIKNGISLSFLRGFYHIPRYKISLENDKKASYEYNEILRELIFKIKDTYYSILFIQEEIEILEEMTKRKEENLVLTKLLNNLDIENRAAANIIKSQIERNKFEIIKKKYHIENQKKILLDLIGMDRNKKITVKKINESFPDYDLSYMIENGKKNSFLLKKIELQNNIYKYEKNSIRLKAVPDLVFSFSYNYSNKPNYNYDHYFIFDLYLSLPLMDNISNHYKIKKIDFTLRSNNELKQDVVTGLEENLESLHDLYNFYKKEKGVIESEYEYVFAYYEILKKKYRRGSIPYILLEDQEDKLFNLKLLIKKNMYNTRLIVARIEQYVNDAN